MRQVEKVVEVPRDVVQVVEVEGAQRVVPVERELVKNIVQEKIVPVERVVEKVVEVEKIVEKLVPVLQEVIKIVEV